MRKKSCTPCRHASSMQSCQGNTRHIELSTVPTPPHGCDLKGYQDEWNVSLPPGRPTCSDDYVAGVLMGPGLHGSPPADETGSVHTRRPALYQTLDSCYHSSSLTSGSGSRLVCSPVGPSDTWTAESCGRPPTVPPPSTALAPHPPAAAAPHFSSSARPE